MKRVLIVDDASFMRASIKTMLEKHGFKVIAEAENGAQGVKKYKEFRPDLVTMDITMPEMGGIDAVKVIRQYDPEAKIIMVTAMGQESMVRDAVINGATSFVVKPFKEEHIINTVNKVLSV